MAQNGPHGLRRTVTTRDSRPGARGGSTPHTSQRIRGTRRSPQMQPLRARPPDAPLRAPPRPPASQGLPGNVGCGPERRSAKDSRDLRSTLARTRFYFWPEHRSWAPLPGLFDSGPDRSRYAQTGSLPHVLGLAPLRPGGSWGLRTEFAVRTRNRGGARLPVPPSATVQAHAREPAGVLAGEGGHLRRPGLVPWLAKRPSRLRAAT